ncbi:MAG: hypothetical protein IMF17_06460 [Proteobacteria bacterium]|nr:hypothetical protein [Pseudomonadota bacterium]
MNHERLRDILMHLIKSICYAIFSRSTVFSMIMDFGGYQGNREIVGSGFAAYTIETEL